MKRHDDVGTRPYCSHFLRGNASPCRPVPPLSHKSKAFVGALRMSVSKCRFPRVPTKRQRSAFCGKEEVPAPKAKVFRRKTEQLRRAPTTSAALGERFFLLCHPRIGSSVTLAHVSGRPHRVAPTESRFEMWISQGSRSVRTRLILLTFPVGKATLLRRFFLYPTEAKLLWEPYISSNFGRGGFSFFQKGFAFLELCRA